MKETNWTKWSSIAEIISSIAILITLVYLAIQTQQNTEATIASTRHAVIETDLNIIQFLVNNPSIDLSFGKQELSPVEKSQLENFLIAMARTREHQWLQYKNNLLDEQTLEAYLTGLTINISYPITRKWWELASYDYFDDEFVDEINIRLKDLPVKNYQSPFDRIESL